MIERRKREFSELLWSRYHVRMDDVAADAAALRKAAPETVVAQWDGGRLTLGEVVSPAELEALAQFPPRRFTAHFQDLLRPTVNDALARREVHARDLGRVPEVAEAVRSFREDLMERMLYADYVLKDVAVTDEDIRAEYEARRAELVSPERRKVAHILVETSEEAREIRGKIGNGESFAELARTRSKDVQSARMGGELGWITKKEVPEGFLPVLSLKEGEISEPLKSKFGYHVVRVDQIVPERPLTIDEARDKLREAVLTRKQQEKRKLWVDRLRAASKIRVSQAGIRAFVRDNNQLKGEVEK